MDLLRESLRATRAKARRAEPLRRGRTESPGEARVGDTVVAQDGCLGRIDSIIRSETSAPVYLVVAVRRLARRRYPVVSWSLVTAIDRSRQHVHVRGRRVLLGRLPETLPIVL